MQQISSIMHRDVRVVTPDCSVQRAAQEMKALSIGSIPVCQGSTVIGMLTDRDIAVRSVAEGKDPKSTKVADIMSPNVLWCFEDASTEEVAAKMADHQVRRIPIISRDKALVGIVTLADLATSQQSPETKADTIEGISEDSGRARS